VCLENLKALSITLVFCSENDLLVLSTPSGFLMAALVHRISAAQLKTPAN
jgi:hypothetical protein